jgi:hypothetical protein
MVQAAYDNDAHETPAIIPDGEKIERNKAIESNRQHNECYENYRPTTKKQVGADHSPPFTGSLFCL